MVFVLDVLLSIEKLYGIVIEDSTVYKNSSFSLPTRFALAAVAKKPEAKRSATMSAVCASAVMTLIAAIPRVVGFDVARGVAVVG